MRAPKPAAPAIAPNYLATEEDRKVAIDAIRLGATYYLNKPADADEIHGTLMAQPGGVLLRAGHTEAGCDLAGLAGLTPAAVICEILNEDGSMARLPDLIEFAGRHALKIGTIADLIAFRKGEG
mgnify:CR=1 FL=1